jgi:L-arabinose isomerase
MKEMEKYELWFIAGSQNLYGEEVLQKVAEHSRSIAEYMDSSGKIAASIKWKPTVRSADEICALAQEANSNPECAGLIFWMHTFSPAKMWIGGLNILNKPFLHLHTQFNRDLPWNAIDMDFMNLNQSAHGGREFGYICARMNKARKVVVGFWQDEKVIKKIDSWTRVAIASAEMKKMKVARIGDNMREVAVTEGNKVSAQIKFGFSVNGYGVGDLAKHIKDVSESDIAQTLDEYREEYFIPDESAEKLDSIREAARIELGLRSFLNEGDFTAFTTTFEDLHGLRQLPGLAVQRLMSDGYGFGAEGDWKTAAMLRTFKIMSQGLEGGTSFMEDYTYHLEPGNEMVLGAHMLEVCPSIAKGKPSLEVHPLGIGGKEPPARLVFDSRSGPAINISLIDMGDHFRLLAHEIKAIEPGFDLPRLPVAKTVWKPEPDFETGVAAWIIAGGAHHTVYTQALTMEFIEDFAESLNIELAVIDKNTDMQSFKKIFQ